MMIDPDNPIVKLCAEGIQMEMDGRGAEARELYMQAWERRADAYEACVAAHYIARAQETPHDVLRWNQEALNNADKVAEEGGAERIDGFYPSLYLNMGWSHEVLKNRAEAERYYALAATSLAALPESPYTAMVRDGIENGKRRVAELAPTRETI